MYKDLPRLSLEIPHSFTFFGFLPLGFVSFAPDFFAFLMVAEPSNVGLPTVLSVSLLGPNVYGSSVLAFWPAAISRVSISGFRYVNQY